MRNNCRQCGVEIEIDFNEQSHILHSLTDDENRDYGDDGLCGECLRATELIVKLDRNGLL